MLPVAAESIERFRNDQIEPSGASVGEESLVAGAERGCATDGIIRIGLRHGPAVTLGVSGAHTNLIVD